MDDLAAARLTKRARDELPDEHFAVPGKRLLPIHDAHHTELAWTQVGRTKGLTDSERATARRRILKRAKELGLDTSDWEKHLAATASFTVEARSLDLATSDHPNKMPFTGILTRIGEPSDAPPNGANGRRVLLTAEAATRALDSLLGMALDFEADFDGHNPQKKIGIFTSADVDGNAIRVGGFIYAADFPELAAEIKARKDELGFSFEAQDIWTPDSNADPMVIVDCVFTGAAVLLKDRAAYRSTSIAANAASGDSEMDEATKKFIDELTAAQKKTDGAVGQIADTLKTLAASVADLAKMPEKLSAANNLDKIEPHAKRLEDAAEHMEAAGIGGHPHRGHVAVLRHMASCMRADAAQGKMPHIYDMTGQYWAGSGVNASATDPKAIEAAVTTAIKPLQDKIEGQATTIKDLQAAAQRGANPPERKTLPADVSALLAKHGINPGEGEKVPVATIDRVFASAGIRGTQAITLKTALANAQVID